MKKLIFFIFSFATTTVPFVATSNSYSDCAKAFRESGFSNKSIHEKICKNASPWLANCIKTVHGLNLFESSMAYETLCKDSTEWAAGCMEALEAIGFKRRSTYESVCKKATPWTTSCVNIVKDLGFSAPGPDTYVRFCGNATRSRLQCFQRGVDLGHRDLFLYENRCLL